MFGYHGLGGGVIWNNLKARSYGNLTGDFIMQNMKMQCNICLVQQR